MGVKGIDVVLYSVEGQAVAVGYMECDRQFLHGKCIPSGYKVVRLTWVKSSDIPAPLVLGDPDENFFLSSGQFFFPSYSQFKTCKTSEIINNLLLKKKIQHGSCWP